MSNSVFNQQIQEFYNQHLGPLYRYALSISRDPADAEDLVQSSVEKVAKQAEICGFNMEKSRRFAFRCIRNMATDNFRHNQARLKVEMDLKNVMNKEYATEDQFLVSECFSKLPEMYREVIILKKIVGYTLREISKLQEVSIFTVASRYRRGIKMLKELLFDEK